VILRRVPEPTQGLPLHNCVFLNVEPPKGLKIMSIKHRGFFWPYLMYTDISPHHKKSFNDTADEIPEYFAISQGEISVKSIHFLCTLFIHTHIPIAI